MRCEPRTLCILHFVKGLFSQIDKCGKILQGRGNTKRNNVEVIHHTLRLFVCLFSNRTRPTGQSMCSIRAYAGSICRVDISYSFLSFLILIAHFLIFVVIFEDQMSKQLAHFGYNASPHGFRINEPTGQTECLISKCDGLFFPT